MLSAGEYKRLSLDEFTKAAGRYESDHAGIYKMCRKDYPPILKEIRKEKFRTLLDAGCGTAPMLSLLTREYPECRFVGLDLTPAMIRKAREKRLPNARFVVGDCENMPFPSETFDIIINSQSFHHYPNPVDFFHSVSRVLNRGGRLILRDNTGPGWIVWLINHVEMPLVNLTGRGDVRVYTIEKIREFCRYAGLVVEKVEQQKGFRLHLVARKPEV
ncbi:MAG: methyltransferase domain-containing protein [Lachnospiraceae bacterium]|nr:methyltransferase domain-containing protein [Lachnospiraceae bacterium]